jgi:hypothetical protein
VMPQTKVEVFPNASIFGGRRTWKRYLRRVRPRWGRRSGRRNRRSDGKTPAVPPLGRVPPGLPRKAAFRADGRRVGRMEDTQVWEEVK